jgi:hypothetical protein
MATKFAVITKYVQQMYTKFYNLALENLGAVYNFSLVRLSPISPQIFAAPKETRARGGAVVEAVCYKLEGCGIDSRWCHWNFSLT